MAQNVGTLISAAIRPNDTLDPIASAFASEIKGGLHTSSDTTSRNSIIFERREWGMMCYVTNLDQTFQLKYNYSSTNIMDNNNWVVFSGSGGGGGGTEWVDSVISFQNSEPVSPTNGDRYIVGPTPTGSANWTSLSPNIIAQWNSTLSQWDTTTPTNEMSVRVDNEDNSIYNYEGTFPTGQWYKEKLGQVRDITASTVNGIDYTATSNPPINSYSSDLIFLTKFNSANISGTVSLNVNSLGQIQVKKPSPSGLSNFNPNDLLPNIVYSVTYDGTYFQLVRPFVNDDVLPIKYYIEPNDYIVVPQYYQYWIYGNLEIVGELVNYGNVIISNGSLIMSGGTFSNYGQLVLVTSVSGATTSYNDTDTIDFNYQTTVLGPSVSAVIKQSSLTASLLNTGNNGGATAGYVLSNTGDGNFQWIQSSNLSVSDYLTSTTYSNVSSITFRGGVVSVPGGTATGVLATGVAPAVTVWIPAPTYVGYFSPTLGSGAFTRFISNPGTNSYTSSVAPGVFGTGDWNVSANYTSNVSRNVTNSSGLLTAFTETEFACFTNGTTMSFTLYNHNGSILSQISNYVLNAVGSTTSNGITITVNSFDIDNDRYKANVTGTIDVGTLFPNGGRFEWNVTHFNGQGPGNISTGVYSFSQSTPVFYDSDGSSSSANISGLVNFDELSASLVYYSGVAFYKTSSTFALTASGVNLLNDSTLPLSKQIDFTCTNLAVTGTLDGYADGTKAYGTAITGWNLNWDNSGLTFSKTATVNSSSTYVPGFSTNNTISTSPTSLVTSRIYDYGLVGSSQSASKLMLFDTYTAGSVTFNNNPLDSETGRLSTTSVLVNGSAGFTSSSALPSDELQYIFGRVIYPQTNFTLFFPQVNLSASIDYSALSGSTKTFTVYTDLNTGATTSVSFSDYRWHVTSYGKDASYSSSFTSGIFTLNSNFTEAVLDYNGVLSSSGTGDLVILVGIDDTSISTTPNKFLFVSGDPVTYGARTNPITYNLNNATEASKNIQWTKGTLSVVVKKCWLFIGYKNSATGKNLRITNIALTA